MVNTFLPYARITSVKYLSRQHLASQRREAKMMIDALKKIKHWHEEEDTVSETFLARVKQARAYARKHNIRVLNHAMTLMYVGEEETRWLITYYNECLAEWERRGYKNVILQPLEVDGPVKAPWWFGWKEFHRRHRISLMRKSNYYEFDVEDDVQENPPYIYPVRMTREEIDEYLNGA